MSHKTNILPRKDGESLTDWTLRFLADAQRQLRVAQRVHAHDCTCEVCERESYNYRRRSREAMEQRQNVQEVQERLRPTRADVIRQIRDEQECTCENNGDYCPKCERERTDADRRRLDDLYRASTSREAEVEE